MLFSGSLATNVTVRLRSPLNVAVALLTTGGWLAEDAFNTSALTDSALAFLASQTSVKAEVLNVSSANQPPVVSSATATFNGDRSLTVTFVASDPENGTIGADAYISSAGGGAPYNASSKKSLAAAASGLTRSFTWTAAEVASFTAAGQSYTVRVDAFDSASALGQGVTNSFTVTAAATSISGYSPVVGTRGTTINVTVTGSNLPSTLALAILGLGCNNTGSGSPTSKTIPCSIGATLATGQKSVTIKDMPNGTQLFFSATGFTVQ